jgi:hypothetical protein
MVKPAEGGAAVIQRFSNDVRRLFGGRFFYTRIFGLLKKMGHAGTKTYKMDTKYAPAAGDRILYFVITDNL